MMQELFACDKVSKSPEITQKFLAAWQVLLEVMYSRLNVRHHIALKVSLVKAQVDLLHQ
jgi:hypothetical protein